MKGCICGATNLEDCSEKECPGGYKRSFEIIGVEIVGGRPMPVARLRTKLDGNYEDFLKPLTEADYQDYVRRRETGRLYLICVDYSEEIPPWYLGGDFYEFKSFRPETRSSSAA